MGVSQIELELKDIMNEYSAEFQRKVEKMCKEVSNACAEELRQTSPSGDGKSSKYKDGWKAVKTTERDKVHYAVANQNKPGLTAPAREGACCPQCYRHIRTYAAKPAYLPGGTEVHR